MRVRTGAAAALSAYTPVVRVPEAVMISRIANALEKQFASCIDMSDYDNRPTQRKAAFLSRGLAALCIKSLADVARSL